MEKNQEVNNGNVPTEANENIAEKQRRIFFQKGIGALLVSLFGLNMMKGFSQVKKATVNSKENLNSLYSPKKIITALDDNSLKAKLRKLDNENQLIVPKQITQLLNENDTSLNEKKKRYNSIVQIDCETGVVKIKADGQSVLKDLALSKIESQIEVDENFIKTNSKKLLPNKVEVLLNQSADLLDRGIKDRSEWDDKAIKFLNIALELQEFRKADDLLKKEVEAGLYERDYKKAKVDLDTQEIVQRKAAAAEMQMNKLITERFSPKALEEEQTNLRRMNTSYTFAGFHSDPGDIGREHLIDFDGTKAPILEFVNSGSLATNQKNFAIQEELNSIQLRQLEANERTASKNKQFFLDKVKWEQKNISFKLEHDQILRETSCYKLASFLEDDGILNYVKRLVPLKQKFNNDFIESLSKLKAAAVGLTAIYDFLEPLPTFGKNNVQFFDDCILWNRNAINFINRSTQNQVTATISISVRSLFSDLESYANSYSSGKWKFTISENVFKDKFQVKMLGLSLSLIGLGKVYKEPFNLDGCFQAKVTVPQKSGYKQPSGKTTILDMSEYPAIPEISIGNVYSNESSRDPDIVGTQIITNLSPIGEWTLSLLPLSRPFVYEKQKNGKIKKTSLLQKNKQINFDGTKDNILLDSTKGVESNSEIVNGIAVQFLPSDFWDLKLDLRVAYLA